MRKIDIALPCAAIFLTTCTTYSGERLRLLTTYAFYSPNKTEIFKDKDPAADEVAIGLSNEEEGYASGVKLNPSGIETAKKLFSAYCRSGKPSMELKVPIRAVLLSPSRGQIIDETTSSLSQVRWETEKFVGSFFALTATGPGLRNGYDYAHSIWTEGKSGDIGIGAAAFQSSSESLHQSKQTSEVPHAVMYPNDPKVYLSYGGARYLEVINDHAEFRTGSSDGVFGMTTGEPLIAFEIDYTKGDYRRYVAEHQMFALKPLRFAETFYFPNYYTMLIPEKEQAGIWRGLHPSRTFFVSSGKFKLSEAVRERHSIWNAYFETFTSYKVAQTKDPMVVDYEVSLDLSLFCAYGRPIEDFITK